MQIRHFLAALALMFAATAAPACDIVDDAIARQVLGTDFLGDAPDPATFCKYVSAENFTLFFAKKEPAEKYEKGTLTTPPSAESIGERARSYRLPGNAGWALHFVADGYFYELTVQTVMPGDDTDYLPRLRAAAEAVLAR